MKITGDLQELVQKKIEEQADPKALLEWRLALSQVEDKRQREAIGNAAIGLASSWADSALWVGFAMAKDPASFFFSDDGE